jgi:serine/threonine-protein kinase Chk2
VGNKGGELVATIEDLSSNGTFINEALIGRNKTRVLQDRDEIIVLDVARFIFRYPKTGGGKGFVERYTLLEEIGKGRFAEVFKCVEKSTGQVYAAKAFAKDLPLNETSIGGRLQRDRLREEIATLLSFNHPNILGLKEALDEEKIIYLVLDFAAEGDLFNWIVMKQKLTEAEARKIFVQLFDAIKYLVRHPDKYFIISLRCLHFCSMIGISSTAISSQRTSCSWTKNFPSSYPTLA